MAPPTTVPRLAQLDTEAVAAEATELLQSHVRRLMFELDPTVPAPVPDPGVSGIHGTAFLLAKYAITGRDPEDNDLAHDRLGDLLGALYTCAARPSQVQAADLIAEIEGEDPGTDLECVIIGAWARIQLAEGHPLRARDLAVLAGLSVRQVRQLAASGEIATKSRGRVAADVARRWLAARGVAGVTA